MRYQESRDYEYDVCFSFAGEDRLYVGEVAKLVQNYGVRVFYDEFQEVNLWGRDLYEYLADIYTNQARYCVLFISKSYASKLWPNHERKNAQARALKEHSEYILPARFDDTEIPGLPDTIGYIDLKIKTPETFATLLRQKVGFLQKSHYMPQKLDLLVDRIDSPENEDREEFIDYVVSTAHAFYDMLLRMSEDERRLMYGIFALGCAGDYPENIHIEIELLKRATGFPVQKIKRMIAKIQCLGFDAWTDTHDGCEFGSELYLYVTWRTRLSESHIHDTQIASEMIKQATSVFCEEHGFEAIGRLDFSNLSSSTFDESCDHG